MPTTPKSDVALRQEQQKIYLGSGAALVLCAIVLGGAHMLLPRLISPPAEDLRSQLIVLAGANLLLVAWVIMGVGAVARGRRHSAEDINGSAYAPPGPKIAVASAFLQNTLEQFVIASTSLSALLLFWGEHAIPFISASVLLFGLGRISFFLGYPKGAGARSFGMALTMLPSIVAFLLSIVLMIRSI